MMPTILSLLLVLLLSYLIGSIPFGLLIGYMNRIDIREYGSHNIGATNVRRVLGRDWGILCFLCDFLKGLLPVIFIGRQLGGDLAIGAQWGELAAACAAVFGHIFPVYLKFKGGKGVSTTLGAILGLAFWPVLVAAIVWYLIFLWRRMVSLASIIAAIFLPLTAAVMFFTGFGPMSLPALLLMVVLAVLVIIRHRENIARIRNGTENTFVVTVKQKE